MNKQQSFNNDKKTLYIVSTPIGNLKDITFRAIETLNQVDYILAEDSRVTDKLLKHYQIQKPVISYHEHNKFQKEDYIISLLEKGHNLALVSDAGTPLISDPGYEIVKKVMEENYNVVAIPGASAILASLITSSIAPMPFVFIGFIPRKESEQKALFEKYKNYPETLIFYESPKRIVATLNQILPILGNRQISLAREVTKKFETIINGSIEDILKEEISELGEYVLIIEGAKNVSTYDHITIHEHVLIYIKQGHSEKEALKLVAKDRNLKKNEIYKVYKINDET